MAKLSLRHLAIAIAVVAQGHGKLTPCIELLYQQLKRNPRLSALARGNAEICYIYVQVRTQLSI